MAKNTVIIVIAAILVIHGLFFCSPVKGFPVAEEDTSGSELMDLETSANTIIFRPMFVYHLQQRRLALKLEKLRKLKAQRAQQQQKKDNQLK